MSDPTVSSRGHRLARMTGRDPGQGHRAATPLELLFDLTFVVAFGLAADQFAHIIAVCLLVVTLAPAVSVVGFETLGHRHQEAMLERALG